MEYLEKSLVCVWGEYLLMKEFLKNNFEVYRYLCISFFTQ